MLSKFFMTTSPAFEYVKQENLLDGRGALIRTIWVVETQVRYGHHWEDFEWCVCTSEEEAQGEKELILLLSEEDVEYKVDITKFTPKPYKV